jgi:hypothetical protein
MRAVRTPNTRTRDSLHSVASPTVRKRRTKPALSRDPKPTSSASPLEVCQGNSTSLDQHQIYTGSSTLSMSSAGRPPSLGLSPPATSKHDGYTFAKHTPHPSSDGTMAPQPHTICDEYVYWNKEEVTKRFEGIAPGLARYVKPAEVLLRLFPVQRNKSGQDLVCQQQSFIDSLIQGYVPFTLLTLVNLDNQQSQL